MMKWLMTVAAFGVAASGCGNDHPCTPDGGPTPAGERARNCPSAQSADAIPQRLDATAPVATMTFADLSSAVRDACAGCHQAPSTNGNFSYQPTYAGISSHAPEMASQLLAQKMPPDNIRTLSPEVFLKLGAHLQAWIDAGKPQTDAFPLPGESIPNGQQLPPAIAAAMTDIGDCVPVPSAIGQDPDHDALFAAATALPAQLDQTDLVSLDAYELAKRGTVGYDVEYPLWADNAHKGRWVHVPAKQPIQFDSTTGRFQIPDNTRFYKTFFKQVVERDGATRYRKVETRLIVVRHAPGKPLFGTYLWDASETSATLNTTVYHDGSQFADVVMPLVTDVNSGATRTYAVPGRTRCNDCHQGSESDSFILGFTPIQINRRAAGDASGHQSAPGADELSQLGRLASYGVISGISADSAPKLENTGGTKQARNSYELQFQGYATGNCAHCHNQKGYAWSQGITLLFTPGSLFQFQPGQRAAHPGAAGDWWNPQSTATSAMFEHMAQPTHVASNSGVLHMPLHTPGIDCNGVNMLGKWIMSVPASAGPSKDELAAAMSRAAAYDSGCTPQPDITWLNEDFSDPPVYEPRRGDWQTAMPASIRALELSDSAMQLANTRFATGWWLNQPQCKYPDITEDQVPGGTRDWMFNTQGAPKFPFGTLMYQKPGEYLFQNVCYKCHGPHADADTALAKTILALTGITRVANLHDGLFGDAGANTSRFDVTENGRSRNLAVNYLLWMASGGTLATFPDGLTTVIGTHGGNMLFLVRDTWCGQLLPNAQFQRATSSPDYELIYAACTLNNTYPVTSDLGYDTDHKTALNPDLQNAWLDQATMNAGMMIFLYLKDDIALDHWHPTLCSDLYPLK